MGRGGFGVGSTPLAGVPVPRPVPVPCARLALGGANRIGPDGQDQVAMEWKVLLFLHASMRTGSGELRITFGHGDSHQSVHRTACFEQH